MKIEADSGVTVDNPCEMKSLDNSERVKRGMQYFSMFFSAAIVSVFIPVLHFFLVPTFLILSVYMATSKYRQDHFVDLTGVTCPKCHHDLNEKKMYFEGDLLKVYCYNCRTSLRIY